MDDWCPENDGAFRAEMAALHRDASRARIEALTAANERLQARVDELEEVSTPLRPLDTVPVNTPVLVWLEHYRGHEGRWATLRLYRHAGEQWWVTTDDESQINHNWNVKGWLPLPKTPVSVALKETGDD